jgi:hypothetical protein
MRRILLSAVMLLSVPAHAVSTESASAVVEQFTKLPVPDAKTDAFTAWSYDMAGFAATECWIGAYGSKKDFPASLAHVRPVSTGTYSYAPHERLDAYCNSIATHGIAPVCTHSTLWIKGARRDARWPMEYLLVEDVNAPLEVQGTLGCYLNADQVNAQSFVEPLHATWLTPPHADIITRADGPQHVTMGNIMVTATTAKGLNGNTYQEPRIAIVVK